MRLILINLAATFLATGCGTAPTTANQPAKFDRVHAGTYDSAKQAQMVDCVFDGFLGSQNMAVATHVRQVKRANGYRIDVIASAFQYVVADVRDDGEYQLTRSTYAALVNLDKEEAASLACLEQFGKVMMAAPPRARSENPYATAPR